MNLVVDANILFAALVRESSTSDMLFKHTLHAPEFILEEFKKYKEHLKGKTKRSEAGFAEFFDIFERTVNSSLSTRFVRFLKKQRESLQIKKMSLTWL
jgi:predicted nucleic acid-binding protein